MSRCHLILAVVGVAVVAGLFAGLAFYRASRAVRDAESDVAASTFMPVSRTRLPGRIASPIEYFAAPAAYRDACTFAGRLFVGGGAGLFAIDETGHITESWRTGEWLPAPVLALSATASDLWIATAGGGLLRFDGKGFEQVLPAKTALRTLTAVFPLSTGGVLLGTGGDGVLAWDGKRLAHFHPELARGRVTALAGSGTDLWAATSDLGLLHFQAGQVRSFSEREGLPDTAVLSVAVSGDRAWAGTALGIAEFRSGRFARVIGDGLLTRSMYVDGDELLAGTLENGVYRIPLTPRRPSTYPPAASGTVERIINWAGRVWALSPANLHDIRSGQPLLAPEHTVLADANVSALAVDPRGRLWVGYFDRGLDVIESGHGSSQHYEDQHLFCINQIVHDPARSLTAVATANGLVMLDSNVQTRQMLGRRDGLLANHVTAVSLVPGGMVVGTPAGLTWLDAGGPRSLYAFHGLINNHVYTVAAADGRVLAGTLGGVSVLDAGFVKANYSTANSPLRQNWITAAVRVGPDFYVGTYGAGVLRLDGSARWHTFPDLPALEINPNALASSGDRVYAGSLGRGLWIYSAASNRWTNVTRGLPSSNVTALAAAAGYLYAGTDNGVVRIPESAL